MKTKKWPVLYKKTSTGAIQMWEVWVKGSTMYSQSGQVDGAKIPSEDTIREGKNIGKANETTPEEQALAEAESRWIAKKKKGYVEKITDASKGKVDKTLIEGGYNVMLAKKFEGDIEYPVAVQPKLDGIRCAATGSSLWTRTRKPIRSVPHIEHALERLAQHRPGMTDGELYNHEYKSDFEKITTIVGQKKDVDPNHEIVQYHIYDIPSNKVFKDRIEDLKALASRLSKNSPLVIVPTFIVENDEELMEAFREFLEMGYEGAMIRDLNEPYIGKRSSGLLKLKEFVDAEFEIVGGEEGRGKLQGHLGAFICKTTSGVEFKAKMDGETSRLIEYWENLEDYVGKMLTVKYQALTGKNKVPRFPVGKAIRDYE